MLKTIGIILVYCIIITILHEGGHYLMSRRLGLKPDLFKIGVGPVIIKKGILEVTMFPLSGMVNHPDQEWNKLSVHQQNLIAAAGPAVNLITGLITVGWLPLFGLLNLLVFVENLIPIQASRGLTDGGYVFRGIKPFVRIPVSIMLVVITVTIFLQVVSIV